MYLFFKQFIKIIKMVKSIYVINTLKLKNTNDELIIVRVLMMEYVPYYIIHRTLHK